MNEGLENDPARRDAKAEESSGLRHIEPQPWHFPVRPEDHRYEMFTRRFSGDCVPGACPAFLDMSRHSLGWSESLMMGRSRRYPLVLAMKKREAVPLVYSSMQREGIVYFAARDLGRSPKKQRRSAGAGCKLARMLIIFSGRSTSRSRARIATSTGGALRCEPRMFRDCGSHMAGSPRPGLQAMGA